MSAMFGCSATAEIRPFAYHESLKLTATKRILRKEGDRLILEPIRTGKLLSTLRKLGPLTEEFPNIDDTLPPLDEPNAAP